MAKVRTFVILSGAALAAGCAGPQQRVSRAADFTTRSSASLEQISSCLAGSWDANISVLLESATAYSVLAGRRLAVELYVTDLGTTREAKLYFRAPGLAQRQSRLDRLEHCL